MRAHSSDQRAKIVALHESRADFGLRDDRGGDDALLEQRHLAEHAARPQARQREFAAAGQRDARLDLSGFDEKRTAGGLTLAHEHGARRE